MFNKTITVILTGTTFMGILVNPLHLQQSFAGNTQGNIIAQLPPLSIVKDIRGFTGVITSLGVTLDGKDLIVASNDDKVTAFDLQTLEQKYSEPLRANPYSEIAFSSDGKLFAVGSKQQVAIFNTETGKRVKTLGQHNGNISSLAISPDGRILVSVSGEDWTIKIWDLENGSLIKELGEDIGPVTTVAFSPDGKIFVTGAIGTDRTIKFWDSKSFKLLNTSEQQPGFINSLVFTPNGKELVGAVRNFVKVWDLTTNKEKFSIKASDLELNQVAVSSDNRLVATANRDGKITIIDLTNGKVLGKLEGHQGWIQSLAFSADGKTLYSGAEDKIVKVWDLSQFDLIR
jgi:WD40 repeat protein